MVSLLLAWIQLHTINVVTANSTNIVQTEYGFIEGMVTKYGRAFYGVPFAAPPVQDLRWTNPMPPQPWSNTLKTIELPPACPQPECNPSNKLFCQPRQSEDCLYLNVFTPNNYDSNNKLPVLLWFYGGSFNEGYSGLPVYNGTFISNLTNTIIITSNYRVGALGFLWNDKLGLQGNYGYFDQVFATEWAYRNIPNFGGDKSRIVIFGESAGAHSVALHILNKSSIISGAIMESACIGLPLRKPTNWGKLPAAFAETCGCSSDIYPNPGQRLQCLKNVSFIDIIGCQIISNQKTPQPGWYLLQYNQPWVPTVNTNVLIDNPLIAIQNGYWNDKIPIIIGSNKGEGWAFVDYAQNYTFDTLSNTLREEFGQSVAIKVLEFYNVSNDTQGSTISETAQIITDFHFRCPARNVSAIKRDNIYNFHFDHASSFNYLIYGNSSGCNGNACHSAEIPYVFDDDLTEFGIEFTKAEKDLAIEMIKYWTNFAKSGNPNNGQHVQVEWNMFGENEQVLMINTEETTISTHFDDYNCNFWDSLGWPWFDGTD